MAAPTFLHQLILSHLSIQFYDCAEQHDMPCEVFQSPCDVRLDRDNYTVVQPDLLVICGPQDYLHMKRLEGAPDLAVEILSPSTRSKDMILKLYKYEKAGVREYWIVDPEHRTVTVHFFDTDVYDPVRYSFHDQIPVGISEGKCSIDFSRIESESLCVIDCHISQNFAVQLDTAELKAIHEFAVGKAVDACRRVDAGDPQLTELSLSLLASRVSAGQSAHDGLLGDSVLFGTGSSVTLCQLQDSVMFFPGV